MKEFKEKYLTKLISKKEYIILFAVVFVMMIPFMGKNYINGDDTGFHVANIYAILQNLISGTSFGLDKVLPILGNDFGYGTGIFYPRLAHTVTAYIALLFAGNITIALKIVHFLVYLLSAIFMYKLTNRVFKNKYISMIAGIFYVTFPYSISEVFSRGSLAESFVYVFTPMVLLSLYELFSQNKKMFYIYFIIGYIGLIGSHSVLTLYFTAFVVIYLLFNIKKVFTKENFTALFLASIVVLLVTLPFSVPLLEHKALGIYHVFESESMSNRNTISYSAMSLQDYFDQSEREKFTSVKYCLNILAFVMAIIAIIMYKKLNLDKGQKTFFKYLVVLSISILILMSNLIPWYFMPQIIRMLQFVWRLEVILILGLSILAALSLKNLKSRVSKSICFIVIIAFNAVTAYNAYSFENITEYNIESIDISSWGLGYEKEYLPEVTINNIEYYNNRGNDIIVSENSKAQVEITKNNTPELVATITNVSKNTVIEFPRIYYLGYSATIQDEEGNITELDLYMNGNGFIETVVNTNGTITLTYEGTFLSNVSKLVCVITILVLIILVVNLRKNTKTEE